jgi:hypothetical protein
LQAKFDRRVSDPSSRHSAAELIEEWRRRSMVGGSKPDPDQPINEWSVGELMMTSVGSGESGEQFGHPTLCALWALLDLPIDLKVAAVDLIDHWVQLELATREKSLDPRIH